MTTKDAPEPAAPAISLHDFTDIDHSAESTYVAALEAFDRLPLLRELKALAIERTGTGPGRRVLDVGCGFGLETLRLARLVAPGGAVTGIDLSADFVAEARRRAAAPPRPGSTSTSCPATRSSSRSPTTPSTSPAQSAC